MNSKMRIYHRYLGFFLAGIMAVYALTGIVMIFRETDFLKSERDIRKELAVNLSGEEVGRSLKIRDFKVDKEEGNIVYFRQGTYDKATGVAQYKAKQLPYVLDRMTKLHKATTNSPMFFLNIFFGLALLFFCSVGVLDVFAQDRCVQKRYLLCARRLDSFFASDLCLGILVRHPRMNYQSLSGSLRSLPLGYRYILVFCRSEPTLGCLL